MKTEPYILVIGASIIDIVGFSSVKYRPHTSNPGKIKVSFGGVARNIAETTARLGLNTKFISVLGDDENGKRILEHSKLMGYDMADSLRLKNSSTPTYMAILDEKGEMVSALVDVQSLNHLNNTFIDSKASLIKGAEYVFVDANNPILLEHILKTYSKNTRFVLDPISTAKAETVKHLMPFFHTVKPNRFEAEALVEYELDTPEALIKAADDLLRYGVENVFISLDQGGVFYANNSQKGILKANESTVINVTGAGDSFVAGLGYGYLNKLSFKNTLKFAISSSLLTISTDSTIHPNMSAQAVKDITQKTKWEDQILFDS
jgi:pseudouridine kinase